MSFNFQVAGSIMLVATAILVAPYAILAVRSRLKKRTEQKISSEIDDVVYPRPSELSQTGGLSTFLNCSFHDSFYPFNCLNHASMPDAQHAWNVIKAGYDSELRELRRFKLPPRRCKKNLRKRIKVR